MPQRESTGKGEVAIAPAERLRRGQLQYADSLRQRAERADGYYERTHLEYCATVIEQSVDRPTLQVVPERQGRA